MQLVSHGAVLPCKDKGILHSTSMDGETIVLLKSLCLHSALSVYGNPVRVFVKELQSFNIIPVPHALDVQLF